MHDDDARDDATYNCKWKCKLDFSVYHSTGKLSGKKIMKTVFCFSNYVPNSVSGKGGGQMEPNTLQHNDHPSVFEVDTARMSR